MLALRRLVREVRPDVIYTSQQVIDIHMGRLLARMTGTSHVVHLHYSVGPWLGRSVVRAIKSSRQLVAVSEFVRETAVMHGADKLGVSTLLNPLPFGHRPGDAPSATNTVRASLGIAPDAPLVLAAGRLDPDKGHIRLLDAFGHVQRRVNDARLVICGTSSPWAHAHERSIREHCYELGLERAVIFAGFRSDMTEVYEAADVFCLPSELEPFGLVFLEAMNAGLPIIAARSGGVPELVTDGVTGLLAYPDDAAALARNLLTVVSDPATRRRLGDAGRDRVARDFDPSEVAARWWKMLQGASVCGP
jgi:glycosyltransferase involved in cell wall biosynthesis